MLHWGFPCPPSVPGNRAVTNIRNTASGYWWPWTGTRAIKAEPVEGVHELFAFLTCEPNAIVAPIHPKAMPVILTTPEECDTWLTATIGEALHLQRPLPDTLLSVVAVGEKQDGAPEPARKPALLL